MTQLQAHMLVQTMALLASLIASECLEKCEDDPALFEHMVAQETAKAFKTQLTSMKFMTKDPRPKQRPTGAQEPKPK